MTLYVFNRENLGWTVRAHDPLQAKLLLEAHLSSLLADPPWIWRLGERLALDFEWSDARALPRHEGRVGVLDCWASIVGSSIWMWR
jgi:hypothetical protein